MAYVVRADLEARIGTYKVRALYTDDVDGNGVGVVNTDAITTTAQAASDLVDALIARSYTGPWPNGSADPVVKEAALLFFIAMSFERAPEYAAQYGEHKLMAMRGHAEKLCDKIATGLAKAVTGSPAPGRALKYNPLPGAPSQGGFVVDPNGNVDMGDF